MFKLNPGNIDIVMFQKQFYSSINHTETEQLAGKYLTSFQRKTLQKNLQKDLSDKQRQRIQIMLLADEGKTQVKICRQLGCSQATARHWMMMARTNQAHNWDSNPIGRPTTVSEQYLERLKQLVKQNPQEVHVPNRSYKYPFKRWTAQKLTQHLKAEFKIEITPQHLNRLLRQMGLSTRSQPTAKANKDFISQASSRRGIEIRNLNPMVV